MLGELGPVSVDYDRDELTFESRGERESADPSGSAVTMRMLRRMIEMTVEFTFRCLRRQELTNNFESGSWCVSWSSDLPNAASMQPSLFICTHGAILLNCRTYKYHYDV